MRPPSWDNTIHIGNLTFTLELTCNGKKIEPNRLNPGMLYNIQKTAQRALTKKKLQAADITSFIFRWEKKRETITFQSLTLKTRKGSDCYVNLDRKYFVKLNGSMVKTPQQTARHSSESFSFPAIMEEPRVETSPIRRDRFNLSLKQNIQNRFSASCANEQNKINTPLSTGTMQVCEQSKYSSMDSPPADFRAHLSLEQNIQNRSSTSCATEQNRINTPLPIDPMQVCEQSQCSSVHSSPVGFRAHPSSECRSPLPLQPLIDPTFIPITDSSCI